jgi:NAD(P)-dependent dehydrogenase (short-subunit alcohol dehydrogenase family)
MTRPVALLTMATGYVGPALARTMADRGFDLVLQGADESSRMVTAETPFSELVPDLEARGAAVETVNDVDLTTAAGNQTAVQAALDRFGRLDSACLVTGVIITGKFLDMTTAQWEQIKLTNLTHSEYDLGNPPIAEHRGGSRRWGDICDLNRLAASVSPEMVGQ